MRKRAGAICLSIILSLCLIGCGSEETQKESETESEQMSISAQETETSEEIQSSEESQVQEENEPVRKEYQVAEFEIPQNEGMDFVRSLKLGFNLGNGFDAYDCTWLNDEMEYESAWCGAKATPELFDALKEAGFQAVRIPVSWHNHLVDDKYTISENWLNRVNEVVDYCIDRDMKVILNIHHDNSKEYFYPSSDYLKQSKNYITAIWSQLAERFKDYDERLLFAAMNEPRLVGHDNEWWINNSADCADAIECINILNQTFVDTVRKSGGNNSARYLICPGYDASSDGALNAGFRLPTDPVDNDHHIIVSVHAYTPYSFALDSAGTDTWTSDNAKNVSDLVGFMNQIYRTYVANGIPVVIDEFGAMEKNGNLESRIDFAGCYIANAKARGLSCFWWDNNFMSGNGERFGIINRKTYEWAFPGIVEAMARWAE